MRRAALLAVLLAAAAAVMPHAQADDSSPNEVRTPIPTSVTDADVFIVGDSLTVGAAPYLDRRLSEKGWRGAIDAVGGRNFNQGLGVLQRNKDRLPPTVVVALATNDMTAEPWAIEWWVGTARHIVGARRLIFVNVYIDPAKNPVMAARQQRVNDAIARSAGIHAAEVADWASYARAHNLQTEWDGVHYGPETSDQRAQFYALSLDAQRAVSR